MPEIAVAPNQKALDAIEAQKEARRNRARSEVLARDLYAEITGIELPRIVPWTDAEGNLWTIHVWCEIRLVKRGGYDADTDT